MEARNIDFTEQRASRDKCMRHIDVLDRVKRIMLIPKMECLTTKMVAEYFDVDVEVIQKCYQRNKEEIENDGVQVQTVDDFRVGLNVQGIKSSKRGGGVEFPIGLDKIISVPFGFGTKTFSKRAVLRIAMLLRDSEVAKAVRTQLLDVFEQQDESELKRELSKYACGSVWHWKKDIHNAASDRPMMIVSEENRDEGFATVLAVPITRTHRGWATETPITVKDGVQSYICGDQIRSIQIANLSSYYGTASYDVILDVKNKLMLKLGLVPRRLSELKRLSKIVKTYQE